MTDTCEHGIGDKPCGAPAVGVVTYACVGEHLRPQAMCRACADINLMFAENRGLLCADCMAQSKFNRCYPVHVTGGFDSAKYVLMPPK